MESCVLYKAGDQTKVIKALYEWCDRYITMLPHILNVMDKINPVKCFNNLQCLYTGLRHVCSTDRGVTTINALPIWGESVRQGHNVCSCNQSWQTFLLNERLSLQSLFPSYITHISASPENGFRKNSRKHAIKKVRDMWKLLYHGGEAWVPGNRV